MSTLVWLAFGLEIMLAVWVVRFIWRTENERPTEKIVPSTDEEVELVG
jgi:hypothetical protein